MSTIDWLHCYSTITYTYSKQGHDYLQVMDEKEHASSELDDLRQRTANKLGGDSPKMGEAGGVASEEVTYLKAENSALQKSIQSKYSFPNNNFFTHKLLQFYCVSV